MSNNRLEGDGVLQKYFTQDNGVACFKSLQSFNLSHNLLWGQPSVYWGSFSILNELDLSNNNMQGSIPSSLDAVQHIYLNDNPDLVGSVASDGLHVLPSFVNLQDSSYISVRSLSCPVFARKTLYATIALDPSYLKYEHCKCSCGASSASNKCSDTSLYWSATEHFCFKCPESVVCSPNIARAQHAVLSGHYPTDLHDSSRIPSYFVQDSQRLLNPSTFVAMCIPPDNCQPISSNAVFECTEGDS
jgi:hypothetical protein